MNPELDNRNVNAIGRLPSPREVRSLLPLPAAAADNVVRARQAIRDLVHGRDSRLLVVVGPCSIHDPDAALEYATRLRGLMDETQDRLLLVMRTYLEKPRTVLGWKGIINDPRLDGSCDVVAGLEIARRLLVEINSMGVPCGSELLDPITPQYVADGLTWAAIGARTTASQTHREMASGLSMPVGLKNSTDGSVEVAANALRAVASPHTFLGIDTDGMAAMVRTTGNRDGHVILRGGDRATNYAAADVARALDVLGPDAPARPVLVDTSHGNSGKDPARQPAVAREVLAQVRSGERRILGLLVESHLHGGRQSWASGLPLEYGVSITDPCIGWEETRELLLEAADSLPGDRRSPARRVLGTSPVAGAA